MNVLTAEQIRAIDRRTIDDFGIPEAVLMERAALGVTEVASHLLNYGFAFLQKVVQTNQLPILLSPAHSLGGKKIVIVCGKGNNGGDGLVVARQLWQRGAKISVFFTYTEDAFSTSVIQQLAIVKKMGIPIFHLSEKERFEATLSQTDLVIDAVFGTGFSGEVRKPLSEVFALINHCDKPILSVDIPSGLDGTTGEVANVAVKADVTVTFHCKKTGLVEGKGKEYSGLVVVWDIGLVDTNSSSVGGVLLPGSL
ncbi:MAG: NAD(P)H-hydrate epimerase [bacterium]